MNTPHNAENDAPGPCWRCHGDLGWYGLHGVWEPCPACDPTSVIPPEQPDWFIRKTHIIPPDASVSMSLSKGHTAEKDLRRRLFAAVVRAASPDEPSGHLPNCGYTDEAQVCGCADFGKRLWDAITECVIPPGSSEESA